jgi:hypothetical protein
MQTESRAGVDALTYGLATLVKGQEVFGEAAFQRDRERRRNRPERFGEFAHLYPARRRRLGNYYAQYTKKFSLGNGPADCVREYLITKEGGKMLGTLVALAVARMKNLEAFVWDMPTGVLRDVWLALSALGDRDDDEDHRLEKLWVRWHNNWQTETVDSPPPPPNIPPPNIGNSTRQTQTQDRTVPAAAETATLPLIDRVEHPTFSVLPELKSLTVLEIDELAYLDEMAILIARSSPILKELRIGIARHARNLDWTKNWEGDQHHQVDHSTTWTIASKIGDKRLQGVMGVLVGRMHNLRNNAETTRIEMGMKYLAKVQERLQKTTKEDAVQHATISNLDAMVTDAVLDVPIGLTSMENISVNADPTIQLASVQAPLSDSLPAVLASVADLSLQSPAAPSWARTPYSTEKVIPLRPAKQLRSESKANEKNGPYLNGCLRLETLELERVNLSLPVFKHVFDFTTITNLTLINCQGHERLWKDLRLRYAPGNRRKASRYMVLPQGALSLKKIHTDTPSNAFLRFVKETLRPNTLETLFIQDRWGVQVNISAIFKNAVRRHRSSLKRLLIDSSQLEEVFAEPSNRWRKWRLTRKMVAYVTSGRMTSLRELAVNIDYADWHIFLQRLPRVPNLRSLYIPHIADHPHGSNIDTHDLALQIVDIVTLRPEIELCYMGLGQKCFEILENRPNPNANRNSMSSDGSSPRSGRLSGRTRGYDDDEASERDSEADITESDDDTDTDEGSVDNFDADHTDTTDSEDGDVFHESHEDEGGDSASDSDWEVADGPRGVRSMKPAPKLRLQEILFYDKIAIFKARHGRL